MLKTLQESFQEYLKNQEHPSEQLLSAISNTQPNKQTRLGIYHNAYRIRLLETLRSDFPKLLTLLGDDYFNQLGLEYLSQCPSTHFSIDQFGSKFPDFLKNYPNLHQAVYELSQFEWTLGEIITAPNADTIDKAALLQCNPESWAEIRCVLHPSVKWHMFEWQPMVIWNHLNERSDEDLPAPTHSQKRACLFWRKNLQTYFRTTASDAEYLALQALATRKSFAETCETLCLCLPETEVASEFSQMINLWLNDGLIQKLRFL
jgi:hypothetical protein